MKILSSPASIAKRLEVDCAELMQRSNPAESLGTGRIRAETQCDTALQRYAGGSPFLWLPALQQVDPEQGSTRAPDDAMAVCQAQFDE